MSLPLAPMPRPSRHLVRSERLRLASLVFFAFANALLWSRTVLPGRPPDEPGHLAVVRFEAIHARIPELGVDDVAATYLRTPSGRFYPYYPYSAQPGLGYLLGAAVVRLAGVEGGAMISVARLPGVCWAALMPLAIFWGASGMIGRRDAALLAAALSTVWPQLTYLFSYVNNDALTVLLSALAIGSWYHGLDAGWPMAAAVRTGLLAGLLLVNKPNGFAIAFGSLFALGTMVPPRRAARTAAAVLAVAAAAGWWYLIAWQRYGADLLGYGRSAEMLRRLHGFWPSARRDGIGFLALHTGSSARFPEIWLIATARSSFAAFGEMNVYLSPAEYLLVLAFVLASGAGLVRALRSALRSGPHPVDRRRWFLHGLTAAVVVLLIGAAAYRSWAVDYQAQGRYLFPLLLPFFALLALGLLSLSDTGVVREALAHGALFSIMAINLLALTMTLVAISRPSFTEWLRGEPLPIAVWAIAALLFAVTVRITPAAAAAGSPVGGPVE